MTTETPSLADALARVQAQLTAVGKDKTAQVRSEKGSYSYGYADLAAVQAASMPLLAAEGLAWITRPTMEDGHFVLAYSLIHGPSGEREDGVYPLPNPSQGTPQQIGSAITYGRRYCLSAVVGVATEDDDGAAASDHSAPKARAVAERAAQAPKPSQNVARIHIAVQGLDDEAKAKVRAYAQEVGYPAPAQMTDQQTDDLVEYATFIGKGGTPVPTGDEGQSPT